MASQDTSTWVGRRLIDSGGEYVGTVDQIYRDPETDRPTWAVINPGARFVPLTGASEQGEDTVRIDAPRSRIAYAPDVAERDRLTPEEEARLHAHYSDGRTRDAGNGGALEHDVEDVRERQHERFGGLNLGASFFGWLVAVGIAALLTAVVGAAGTAIGLTEVSGSTAAGNAEAIGIAGAVVLLLILALAYFAGGYVAGRMSRFDGGRQGLGVWVFGLLVTIAAAVAGAVFGSQYNVLSKLDLPRIPVDEGSLTTAGVIALAAILLATLLAALAGGKAGERYHRKVDRAGYGR